MQSNYSTLADPIFGRSLPVKRLLYLLLFFLPLWSTPYAQRHEEVLDEYFRKWLNQDVVYIITSEERAIFEKLSTPEEKENFIEQFWNRRDPDRRTTAFNEFKEEHYRRIAYANENFKSGIDGWKMDRGRIYILYGAPTSKESFPTGGLYQRPMTEGGGVTSTYAREVWHYNYVPYIGSGIELEFVDPTGSGEYRLALREDEKDALLYVPGAGNTLLEDLGGVTRAGRLRSSLAMRPLGLKGDPRANPVANPFLKLQRYMNLSRPPVIRFEDLKIIVDVNVHYNSLPFHFRYDVFRYSAETVLCPITIAISNKELSYQVTVAGNTQRATVHVYARVQNLVRRIVYEYEDVIHTDVLKPNPQGRVLYQKLIPISPGRYKINLVLKDANSDRIGTLETLLVIPGEEKKLSSSTLMLAERITAASDEEMLSDPFVTTGRLKIYPNVQDRFGLNDPIGVYLEVYNFQVDQSSSSPDVDVVYEIRDVQREEILKSGNITSNSLAFLGDRIIIARVWRDLGLPSGEYAMRLKIKDLISEESIEPEAIFVVDSPQ